MTEAEKASPLSCESCKHFQPNGTTYGGRCAGLSSWYGLIVSRLKDDNISHCHSERAS